ncbi:MAG: phosphoenolpyruvate--protein phosphotransferase [Lachnospiraceae bacterium]|nr:phosphoenolpyruvate--protein phosphotransferase [Lachnospiraceae bacterium]
MQQFRGKGIGSGIAIGRIFFYEKKEDPVQRVSIEDPAAEIMRFETARAAAIEQLQQLRDKTLEEAGAENAAIFEAHRIMLSDSDYNDSIRHIIRVEKVCAEYAVSATADHFAGMFADMADDYLKARSADIRDISERIVRILSGRGNDVSCLSEPVILAAEDLTPSETIAFDRSKLLAFVTHLGSADSHTAILARTMHLPAVSGIAIDRSWNGRLAVVDGYSGTLSVDPDETLLREMLQIRRRDEKRRTLLQQLKGRESITKSGRKIRLCANISGVKDISAALENDAEGIGLLRSEFLYMESSNFPSEDTQFQAYKTVLQKMEGRQVVIRTLDLGSDKQASYFPLGKEDNPAMGYRAIRICLDHPEIFKTQLRALYRASAYGRLAILFPMIISLEEVLQCKKYAAEVKEELNNEKIPYSKDVELGIMIETPAAALISETLANEVDFFSIGTNDLTQFTLAIDRCNARLEPLNDPRHPAVLELIRMTIENGHKGGAWVGICGELAADTNLTRTLIEYGADELSVSPSLILPVRNEIIHMDCQSLYPISS